MKGNADWDFVPEWVESLICNGHLLHGGGVLVKSPPKLRGLESLSLCLRNREGAPFIEKVAEEHGWIPKSYHRWDEGRTGTISFCRKEDREIWSKFYGREI